MVDTLSCAGYRADAAYDGIRALEWLRGRKPDAPTLILLDVLMPVLGGEAFLRTLSAEPARSSVAVIVFTASALDTKRFLSMPLVRGVLKKPSSLQEVLRTVATCWPEGARSATTD